MTEQNTQTEKSITKGFKIVNMSEVFAQMEADSERWRDEKRVGRVSFDADCGAIVFHFDEKTPSYRYWLPFAKVQTAEGQMQWINHLRRKGWLDIATLNDFLDCLARLGVGVKL